MQAPAASSCFSNYMATTRERTALASLKISMSNGVSVKSVLIFVEGDMRNESLRHSVSCSPNLFKLSFCDIHWL